MRSNYIPAQESRLNVMYIMLYISAIYSIESLRVFSFIDNVYLNYLIKGILWCGLALSVRYMPRGKFRGKLTFQSSLNFWAFNFAIIFLIIYFSAGIFDGYGKSPFNHSISGIFVNLFLVGSVVAGREYARSFLANYGIGTRRIARYIALILLMSLISLPLERITGLHEFKEIVKYSSQYILPEISKNSIALYLVVLGGPLPSIIYTGSIEIFQRLSPVLPDLNWLTSALIGILCPFFSLLTLQRIYATETKSLKLRDIKHESPLGSMVVTVVCIAIAWFSMGIFRFYPSVIATGSMEPYMNVGDVIILDKSNVDTINNGDIIQFKREDISISHRVIEILEKDGEKLYRTKGDNNSASDLELVYSNQIKGKVVATVPKVGWITLLLKGYANDEMSGIQP